MLVIKNAKIYTMADKVIDNGYIVIEDGKIVKVAEENKNDLEILEKQSKDIKVIDAKGMNILPGLVDCHSHIGGMNFSQPTYVDDLNEMTNNVTPEMEAIYGTDPCSQDFEFAYKSGITTLGVTPGSGNVICGLVFATKTWGNNIFKMMIKNPVALKVALGGNPKGVYGDRKLSPSTRMSIPSIIIDLFNRAEEYMEKKEKAKNKQKDMPKYDRKLEIIESVLKKEIPLKIHCTQFDMMTAIEIAKRFDVDFSIEHAWGASEYIEEIVESGGSIVFGPLGAIKSLGESRLIDIESVVELDNRDVLTAITTDAPLIDISSLIHHVGEAVRSGLKVERALRMVTINAAKILGIDDRVGSIEEGKDADIILFKGLPGYNTDAKVACTIINGEIVYSSSNSIID